MVRLTLPAQIGCLEEFCSFVRQGAEATKLASEETEKLCLILEELFMNIARHAYTPAEGNVEVAYAVENSGRLLVEISDSGRPFNPLDSDPPDFSRGLAERPLGGMGVFLARALADSMRYRRDGG